jgi:hypothetical protein
MGKTILPTVVGVAVGIAAAIGTFGLMMAIAWSGIHSGRTEQPGGFEIAMTYVALLFALLVPIGLGFFASWATRRAIGESAPTANSE